MKPLARPFPPRHAEPEARAPERPRRRPGPGVPGRAHAPQPQGRLVAPAGGGERADARRPDLADVRRRRDGPSAFPSSPCRASTAISVDLVVKAAEEAAALGIPVIALFPYTEPSCAPRTGARPSTPTTSCAAPRAPMRKAGLDIGVLLRRGARSLHQPRPRRADARRRDRQRRDAATRWCGRRWCRPRPAATSSRPPT